MGIRCWIIFNKFVLVENAVLDDFLISFCNY